ncbi:CsbD family protein [Candidatus Nitrotoga sp. M5]|uniref:CsbD family protein n=1 Tax=Candidatus Nitrotoga sp. M5 TaxID=2890409 RepID=UPI001EF1C5FA|nr:CsbD family protein [Candidatus Nitrotoga sp. M5]CAH1386939.1 putative stress response protein YjbJ [Candidatus Nitrotoga sp. M5]
MNSDILKGKWEQLKGQTQKQWGKLTNDDVDVVKGNATELSGKIQERYGIAKDEADKQVEDWCNKHK